MGQVYVSKQSLENFIKKVKHFEKFVLKFSDFVADFSKPTAFMFCLVHSKYTSWRQGQTSRKWFVKKISESQYFKNRRKCFQLIEGEDPQISADFQSFVVLKIFWNAETISLAVQSTVKFLYKEVLWFFK